MTIDEAKERILRMIEFCTEMIEDGADVFGERHEVQLKKLQELKDEINEVEP